MYRALFISVGLGVMAVGAVLVLWPQLYLSLYVTYDPAMAFPARRFAPALIGLGALMLAARSLPPGPFPARFALLAAAVWVGIAATGVAAYLAGTAGGGILIASATELLLGGLFFAAARTHRRG